MSFRASPELLARRELAWRLFQSGMSYGHVAEATGFGRSSIPAILRRFRGPMPNGVTERQRKALAEGPRARWSRRIPQPLPPDPPVEAAWWRCPVCQGRSAERPVHPCHEQAA